MAKTLTIIDFMQKFSSEESYKTYLAAQKWGNGFVFRRCGYNQAVKERTRQHRRCGSCRFDESAMANRLSHKIKFPLPAAFAVDHLLTTTIKGPDFVRVGSIVGCAPGNGLVLQAQSATSDESLRGRMSTY